ncbi:hypothetical protein BTM25_05990 [Actinomadura rubteroloni]|uniref:Uncharacterized protein n=1 Tax=Actinomadura rubteroloni TaxID=1926885 RepID=A0A2P4UMD2_9ACTN|nr:hypothetical protein BTM25_05990 [Actinomadura rubteroloni]
MLMSIRDVHVSTETWRFHCVTCSHQWDQDFEARHSDGPAGSSIAWSLDGVASQPPWVDRTCPECRSVQVRALPPDTPIPRPR